VASDLDRSAAFADGLANHRAGRLADAERRYRTILADEPGHADSLHMLGVLAHQRGDHATAASLIGRAIAIDGANAEYHANLGVVLAKRDSKAAAESYRRAIALDPDSAEIHFNLGNALARLDRADEAAASFRAAIARRETYWEAHAHLGNALRDLRQLDEASESFRAAIALNPRFADLHSNLSAALREQNRLQDAATAAREAVALNPSLPEAHFNLALALLPLGDMAAGWTEYEWRWQTPALRDARRMLAPPQWRGEPAAGRTLLLHAEQGFGDTIQFCRYALAAAARGLRVILEAQPSLVRLLRGLPRVEAVIARGDPLPKFDLHCPLLSAPLAMGTTLATIPSALAYLRAEPAQVAACGARLPDGLRVGLAWAGSPRLTDTAGMAVDRRRSLPPALLTPLIETPGIIFVSLQKGGPPAPFALTDPMNDVADFADTAAVIANLDLVISVDTAVAHLAAALGKPVWLLDRHDPCWRWLAGRSDSPWYPTLRIFRQPAPGDWGAVLAEVSVALRERSGLT
jgi:tetratricopeptide (TPR) repeat protein